jgi:V/A-type H+/Na+-transporting ATPase subunit D
VSTIKLTKNELRTQQIKLAQLERYLPTLQLKKAMLQSEVMQAASEVKELAMAFADKKAKVTGFSQLLGEKGTCEMISTLDVESVEQSFESIAGVEIPIFQGVTFTGNQYGLLETPLWFDSAAKALKELLSLNEEVIVAKERMKRLEAELREVSIRVNLFVKVMIPRAIANIKKIKVFLGDQQLAAVAQAKIAKTKIEKRKSTV